MKKCIALIVLGIFMISHGGMAFAIEPIDIAGEIQKRVKNERLLDETKSIILAGEARPLAMNQTRMKNMLDEMVTYSSRRQRPLQSTLSYIHKNRTLLDSTDPIIQTMLEVYMRERYARYISLRTYEEEKRDERHAEAVASLPENTKIPAPRTSDTYQSIVIDISDQRLYAFEDNILVATSPITSGKKGFGTIKGDFDVKKKQTNRVLTSPFKNTDIRYRLHVDYWIQFHKSFGIHDACNSKNCWREKFGTPDYLTKGSHGCVNTPHEFVSWLYEWVLPKTRVSVIQ